MVINHLLNGMYTTNNPCFVFMAQVDLGCTVVTCWLLHLEGCLLGCPAEFVIVTIVGKLVYITEPQKM